MQEEFDCESVFLANLEPWRRGEVLDLNEGDGSQMSDLSIRLAPFRG